MKLSFGKIAINVLNVLVIALLIVMCTNAEAADQNVVIEIKGMTCELCGLAVKKSLSEIDGVRDIQVSLEERKAWLTVNDAVTDNALIDAVRNAGPYEGKIIERRMKE